MYEKLFRLGLTAIVVAALILSGATPAAAASTIVVTPAASNWGFANEGTTATGGYAFVAGPATHTGSLKLTTTVASDGPFFAGVLAGFNVDELTTLQYDVYSPNPTSNMPTLQLDVDWDSTDLVTSWQGRLVFVANGPFTEDAWQTIDALSDTAGTWFATGGAGAALCPLTSPCMWSTVQSTFPNLKLYSSWSQASLPGSGAIGFKKGSGETAPFEGYVDNLVIDTVTYDFQPLTTLYVDDDWASATAGTDPDGAGPALKYGVDSFATIQAAIDAAGAGNTIYVFPGDYNETASGRTVLAGTSAAQGPYQFGLFFPNSKPGLSLIGVNSAGEPITNPALTDLPYITTNATNSFGTSGVWVEGDNVTIQGLEFGPNIPGDNKTIEIVADGFTLKYSNFSIQYGGAVYFGDWQYDAANGISAIESYTIDNNVFDDGTQIAISSGAGYSGDVAERLITNNIFAMAGANDPDPTNWPGISFNGTVPSVGWFVHPVGGAVITGNSFSGSTQYIRSRGTVDEADFDWASYWNDNTYDKKVMAGPNPPAAPRAYTYMSGTYSMTNTKVIGSVIADEIGHAEPGDTVLVGAGTYELSSVLNLDKAGLKLQGTGNPLIQVSGTGDRFDISAEGVTLDGLRIEKTDKAGEQNIIRIRASNTNITNNEIFGKFVIGDGDVSRAIVINAGAFSGINISGNTIHNLRQPAYISGTHTGTISNNYVYQTKGWVLEGGNLTFTNNTWGTGADANVYDIAIISAMPSAYYTDIAAMSAANNGAFIEDQRVSPAVLSAVYVDGSVGTSGTGTASSPVKTISEGITRVVTGGTIHVAAGTYTEQVNITKSLHLIGAGIGSSIIQAPATLPTSGNATSSIVLISGGGVDAELTGFTVTGPGPSNSGSIRTGIYVYAGANANIHHNTIQDIRDNPFSGAQNGVAIAIGRQFWSTSGTATIANNTIIGYQKGGIVVDNAGSNAVVTNNIVTGAGTTNITAQNGIQISRGATATLSGNTVSGNSFHLQGSTWDWGAAGILLYQSGAVTLSGGNTVTGNDQNLYNSGAASLSLGTETLGSSTAPVDFGYDILHYASYALDATTVTFADSADNFAIEDRIWHAIDEAGNGLVTWVPNNIYVTPLSTFYPGAIQRGINAASAGNTVNVAAGTYDEDVLLNKTVILQGAGAATTTLRGIIGGDGATVRISANNVNIAGFTITRLGNNLTDWNNAGLNSAGIAIQGAFTGANIHDNNFVGNRTGLDINNSSGHSIVNNIINDNRTGLLFRNQTDNLTVTGNEIMNNWTVGVLFLDASGGTNVPVQTALNSTFSNNKISGNWYGGVVDRQSGGSLPLPGTTNLKNFSNNWWGTVNPVVSTANSTEPGYAAQIPVSYGGTATAPGGQADILGTASANIIYNPFCTNEACTTFASISVLSSPSGTLGAWNNTFTWTGISGASYYRLELVNVSTNAVVNDQWFNTGVCSGLNCSVAPYATLNLANGDYKWRIQVYNGPWTDYKTFTLNVPTLNLIAPSGALTIWTNVFNWTGTTGATYYHLELVNATTNVVVNDQWFSTSICSGLNCSVSPYASANLANGNYKWRIQTYSPAGYGTWSSYSTFSLNR